MVVSHTNQIKPMSRLIIVPQFPTTMRYQSWWWGAFDANFKKAFDEVLTLGVGILPALRERPIPSEFAPVMAAVSFEQTRIMEYLRITLRDDDVLLLNDLSFPGGFINVLFHKRPKRCFAICHATSLNKGDIFAKDREIKYAIESASAKLFEKVFVATQYHADKLGWDNLAIVPFPMPPYIGQPKDIVKYPIVSVARDTPQKRTKAIEDFVEKEVCPIVHAPNFYSWEEYCKFLCMSGILLVTAREETYGYQIIDAIINGCVPLAPNGMSYPEMIPKEYLYNNVEELLTLIGEWQRGLLKVPKFLLQSEAEQFYTKLITYMK